MSKKEDAPHPVDIHVGKRMRELRKETGQSQTDLADALGLTFQQVQKYERGTNRISASKLHEAARFLGVAASYFYHGLDDADVHSANAKGRAQQAVEAFLRTEEGIELAECFPRVRTASHRKKILGLVQAMAEDEE